MTLFLLAWLRPGKPRIDGRHAEPCWCSECGCFPRWMLALMGGSKSSCVMYLPASPAVDSPFGPDCAQAGHCREGPCSAWELLGRALSWVLMGMLQAREMEEHNMKLLQHAQSVETKHKVMLSEVGDITNASTGVHCSTWVGVVLQATSQLLHICTWRCSAVTAQCVSVHAAGGYHDRKCDEQYGALGCMHGRTDGFRAVG